MVNPHNLCASDNSEPPHDAHMRPAKWDGGCWAETPWGGYPLKDPAISAILEEANRAKSHFDPIVKSCRKHAVTSKVTLPVGLSRGLASRPFF